MTASIDTNSHLWRSRSRFATYHCMSYSGVRSVYALSPIRSRAYVMEGGKSPSHRYSCGCLCPEWQAWDPPVPARPTESVVAAAKLADDRVSTRCVTMAEV